MGTLYVDTGGATTNSGCTDSNSTVATGSNATVSSTTVTLDGSPDLSGLITSGDTQSSIHLNQATNSNMKIFWITGFDNSAKTVTVHVAPTGVTGSAWTIGGRHVLTNASIEGTVRAGDTVIFNNSPASGTGSRWTFRNAGDSASGYAKIVGKTGVRPVLNSTNAVTCVSLAQAYTWVENFEITASSGTGITAAGAGSTVRNVKVATVNAGINSTGQTRIIGCEVTGSATYGLQYAQNNINGYVSGCYIHDNTGDGVLVSGSNSPTIYNTIIESNGGRGILLSTAFATANALRAMILNCTIYGNGDSGLEVSDADANVWIENSIFMDNGNAAGEYNVEWVAGAAEYQGYHYNNCYYKSSNNLSGLTTNSTEITTDPLFLDAANGDFRLSASSPCKATGGPGTFLGSIASYNDMGAVQRQEPSGSGSASGAS